MKYIICTVNPYNYPSITLTLYVLPHKFIHNNNTYNYIEMIIYTSRFQKLALCTLQSSLHHHVEW